MDAQYMLDVDALRRQIESDEALRKGGAEPPRHRDIALALGLPETSTQVDAVWRMFKPYMDELAAMKAWRPEP